MSQQNKRFYGKRLSKRLHFISQLEIMPCSSPFGLPCRSFGNAHLIALLPYCLIASSPVSNPCWSVVVGLTVSLVVARISQGTFPTASSASTFVISWLDFKANASLSVEHHNPQIAFEYLDPTPSAQFASM